ncbi:MAG: hypothetical protein HC892_18240 [Saprospiraceae bacterium]|nr:hypothetical protein [Saprospiraceae bacterium]
MGQFLSIGIVTACGTSKKGLQKNNITKEELVAEMIVKHHFEPSIYDFSETTENYLFKLQSTVIENQLLAFLEKFYPLVYSGKSNEFESAIKKLRTSEPSTWLALADERSYAEFQLDEYGEYEYLHFDKPFGSSAKIFSTAIMLSCEGKISMEEFGRQFIFFKYCMQQTFPEFSIAKALRVYISG